MPFLAAHAMFVLWCSMMGLADYMHDPVTCGPDAEPETCPPVAWEGASIDDRPLVIADVVLDFPQPHGAAAVGTDNSPVTADVCHSPISPRLI